MPQYYELKAARRRCGEILGKIFEPQEQKYVYLTGGYIPNLINYYLNNSIGRQMPTNTDIDFYIPVATFLDSFLVDFIEKHKMKLLNHDREYDSFTTSKFISDIYTFDFSDKLSQKVQLIRCKTPDMAEVINGFDFEHVKSVFSGDTRQLIFNKKMLNAITNKTLLTNKQIVDLSPERIDKWSKRGYSFF